MKPGILRTLVCGVAILTLCVGTVGAQEGLRDPSFHTVMVRAVSVPELSQYSLSITYNPGQEKGIFDAVMVTSAPSGALLMSHYDPNGPSFPYLGDKFQSAITASAGPPGPFRMEVHLPFDPTLVRDNRIIVTVVKDGQEYVVSNAGFDDLAAVDFVTQFDPHAVDTVQSDLEMTTEMSEGLIGQASTFRHCCQGFRCDAQWVNCSGPDFWCDLINCDLSCGSSCD